MEKPESKGLEWIDLNPDHGRWLRFCLFVGLILSFGSGCATYSDRMKAAQDQVRVGNYQAAVDDLNRFMGTPEGELPQKFDSDMALAVLERATLEQALSEFKPSARDFGVADQELQLLDIANDTAGTIGKYFFSDSSTKYKASPVEKLSLNGFNMMNYLALGEMTGASVEARRFTVMRNYLNEFDPGHPHAAFGSYLAGFTFAQQGDYGRAMRYYDEALEAGSLESLREPVARLSKLTSYRGKYIQKFLDSGPAPTSGKDQTSSLLVAVNIGRVPHKVPERMPIGAAIGIAGSYISGNPAVLGYSAFKVVVYPELIQPPSLYNKVEMTLDGQRARLDLTSDLGVEIRNEYEKLKPQIIGAALSRMIVRAAAAEGARQAGKQENSTVGWIAALATEATLVAMDKPDTRSWIFLPNRVYLYQTRVKPGTHTIEIKLGSSDGATLKHNVDIAPGGYAAVIVTAPR